MRSLGFFMTFRYNILTLRASLVLVQPLYVKNTKLVPGEMQLLVLKVAIQADRGLLPWSEFSVVWSKV